MFSLISVNARPINGPRSRPQMAQCNMETTAPALSLADLRAEIDRIDAAMHDLLMERGEIIDRLIKVKHTAETGSAFRPAREADMMRRLVERHHGILPLDTPKASGASLSRRSRMCRP